MKKSHTFELTSPGPRPGIAASAPFSHTAEVPHGKGGAGGIPACVPLYRIARL